MSDVLPDATPKRSVSPLGIKPGIFHLLGEKLPFMFPTKSDFNFVIFFRDD